MTDKQDPITHAARLLREAAEELRQAHAYNNSEGWENETDAKAAYDEHMAAAQALEDWEAAAGAGGVQALSAAPAEQQAMESVLVDGAASQPPISNTLWRMLTGGYEHTYILQLPNDSRDRRELIDRACHNWRRICAEIGNSAVASAVSPQTAQAPQQAVPKAAPGGQNTVPAEWLEQAYREGWTACRDAETIGEEAEDWAFGNSTANSRMIDAQQAAPQQGAQEPVAFIHWPVNGPPRLVWYSKKALNNAILKTHEDGYKPDVKLYSAPQPAPAPLSEMPYEKRKAIQEGEQIGASDAWFHARHNMLDTLDRRNVFRAGFDRGWNAALAAQGGKA